jgi:hypothetical protein
LRDDPAAKFVSQRPVETSLGEANTINQIRAWLDECLSTHPESLLSGDQPLSSRRYKLPTRVIDVGTDSEPIAKLFQPSSVMHEQYITLSYCWGPQRFLTTVSSNIAAHLERLPEPSLPRTFTDAIEITRKLGLRYLWIDALCIIQDSAEDKAIEIVAMQSIYSNSILTIAVVNAMGVADGFLKSKPQLRVQIPYRCPDGILGTVEVSPQEIVDLWQEPLYTRAWCLQENLLSSRLLLFTNTEVIWQCQSHPMKRPNTTHASYQDDNPQLGKSPFARLPASLSTSASQDLGAFSSVDAGADAMRYNIWRNIAQNYTRRKLTVSSDRLPAIAGISQKFTDAWPDVYCAGIWKQQFIPSLTWRRKESLEGPESQYWPPLSKYRAPSWSWASIEGPVEFDYRFDLGNLRGLGARLISCEVTPLRKQMPLGEVQDGKAVLEASLIPARDVPIRGYLGQDAGSFRVGGSLTLDDHPKEWWGRAHVLEDDLYDHAWAMLLGEGRDGSGKMTRTTALILMPTLNETDTYKRVGFWTSSVKAASKLWLSTKNRMTITII